MAKLKFIQTEEYYLVVDEDKTLYEDLVLKNWYWNAKEEELNLFQNAQPLYHYNNYYKVIAHLPKNNSPILEGVDLLPEILSDEEDVEQLAINSFEKFRSDNIIIPVNHRNPYKLGFIKGYKAAKQSEKKYSEQDMRNCYVAGSYVGENPNENFEDFLKSFSTTKEPIDFEVEMEKETLYTDDGLDYKSKMQPKVIEGVLQGRWIFK